MCAACGKKASVKSPVLKWHAIFVDMQSKEKDELSRMMVVVALKDFAENLQVNYANLNCDN